MSLGSAKDASFVELISLETHGEWGGSKCKEKRCKELHLGDLLALVRRGGGSKAIVRPMRPFCEALRKRFSHFNQICEGEYLDK
jgi:hypothetical protein